MLKISFPAVFINGTKFLSEVIVIILGQTNQQSLNLMQNLSQKTNLEYREFLWLIFCALLIQILQNLLAKMCVRRRKHRIDLSSQD